MRASSQWMYGDENVVQNQSMPVVLSYRFGHSLQSAPGSKSAEANVYTSHSLCYNDLFNICPLTSRFSV